MNYSGVVSEAVSFWQQNNHSDLAYSPSFVVEPSAADPHLIIRFTTAIETCGTLADNETVGCAPVLTNTRDADRPEIIEVQRGLTNQSTYRVVRHELGHVLGLEHGEGPDQIMSPTGIVHNRIVRIHLEFDTSATAKQRDSRRQVRHALNYYADGAEGFLDEDVNFALIDERSAADVVVRFRETGGESTASTDRGTFVIAVNGIDIDKRGWHVGYWLGVYFGAESQSELPPPFDEPDTDRRERWW